MPLLYDIDWLRVPEWIRFRLCVLSDALLSEWHSPAVPHRQHPSGSRRQRPSSPLLVGYDSSSSCLFVDPRRVTGLSLSPLHAERLVRGWRRADRSQIRHLLTASRLCQQVPDDDDVEELIAIYDAVLRDTADKLAPVHTVRRRPGRPTPWFDDECRAERRNCRRLVS